MLREGGYAGRCYPISRSHAEVQGLRAYARIAEVPEPVDLALIIIPAQAVPEALEECGRAGARAAYIVSSGFAEDRDADGPALQRAVREIARRYDMAVCGPNGEGFLSAPSDLIATFSPGVEDYPRRLRPDTDKGRRLAVVAQSGGLGFSFFHRGRPRQLRFEYVISTGNEAALESFDFVEHLVDADRVDVVLLYLEGIRDAESFRRAAAKAADRGKPLLVAKMGRSEVAQRAAASHTAALAGVDHAYDAVFRRYGVIRADDMDTMLDVAAGFAFCPLPQGRRVAVISGSGGAAVWMADTLAMHGLEVPPLDEATRAAIDALIPSYGASANPVDVTAGTITAVGYARVVEILQRSPEIDAVVIVGSMTNATRLQREMETLARVAAHPEKPVLMCAYTLAASDALQVAARAGVPVFSSMPGCARALAAMVGYARFQERWRRREPPAAPNPSPSVRQALCASGRVLCEYQAKAALAAYGIPRPPEELAANPEEAAQAAERIGFPVAVKVQSPDLPHKTEVGGIALGLDTAEAVAAATRDVLARARAAQPGAAIHGVLVQKMAPSGREIILGVNRDQTFGPMLMVGLGGIYVEVLRDVAFAPVPLSPAEALDLLASLRGKALLHGVRGELPVDLAALADLVARLSRFAADFADEVESIDLNPVLAHPEGQGLTIVDALIVRRENT